LAYDVDRVLGDHHHPPRTHQLPAPPVTWAADPEPTRRSHVSMKAASASTRTMWRPMWNVRRQAGC